MSDVATLLNKIDQECHAMKQALTGFASVARHRTIARRYKNLTRYGDQLSEHIGTEAATEVVAASYTRIME